MVATPSATVSPSSRLPTGIADVIVRSPESVPVGPASSALTAPETGSAPTTVRSTGTRPSLPGSPPR